MGCNYCSDVENQADICAMVSDMGSFHCPICGRKLNRKYSQEEIKKIFADIKESEKNDYPSRK